ncbi:MAG: DUF1552 domain-containing protein [Gemmataceae bacterium]|nr:DUF1552 domain-containing protein [Gemmataceae bacterium]
MTTKPMSRRTVLRGIGAAISLPWLEAMGPLTNWAAGAGAAKAAPNRMAFLYVPNGKNMAEWTPKTEGGDFELSPILQPLAPVRDDVLVLTGLTADMARPNGDGGGDHARALTAFLTGVQPHKTEGANIRAAITADQVAAARLADETLLPSLEIGCEAGNMAGGCDAGYSCVYVSTMAWRSATQPLPKEVNPKQVFERLFGAGADGQRAQRDDVRKSVLDFVREDTGDLRRQLGIGDQRKLDEYFSAVRDIEQRIARAEKMPVPKAPDMAKPAGIPASYPEHLRLMCDLMVLAFQADIARVCTFVLSNEASNKTYPFIDVPEMHHELSHHDRNPAKLAKLSTVNKFHVSQLAYLLTRLQAIKEGDGTLLDHCMIAYGSGNSDGNAHNHDDLPILLAGKGCGTIKGGRHIRYRKETPLNNLWVAMLDRMKVDVQKLGDSTGSLPGLSG